MLRALFIALCLSFLSACENGMTWSESELVRVAHEKGACDDRPFIEEEDAVVCSLFIVMNDGQVLRLAELRHGIPFVEREFISTHPERYSHTRPGQDRSLVLLMAGPNDLEYTGLWYRFTGAEQLGTEKDEGTET